MRSIEIYKGKEITNEKIAKLKQIAVQRYAKSIYDSSYFSVDNVDQLAYIHDINVDDESLVLGEDWFLCYTMSYDTFMFLEWVALDNNFSKFIQSIEMMNVIKRILCEYRNKRFTASMRHDT